MIFSNEVYNVLKHVTQIVLPAIGTLYFALSGIWGFPHGEEVVGTITAIVTFLGIVLGISTSQYNKLENEETTSIDGTIVIDPENPISGSTYLQFNNDVENIKDKEKIVLDVVKVDE